MEPEGVAAASVAAGIDLADATWSRVENPGFGARVWLGHTWRGPKVIARERATAFAGAQGHLSRALQAAGVPAPRFLGAATSDRVVTEFWTFVEGNPLGDLPTRSLASPQLWGSIGRAFDRLHQAAPPPEAVLPSSDESPWAAALRAAQILARDRADVDRLLSRIDAALTTAGGAVPPAPPTLIHGDPNFLNILVQGATCTGLVDWDQSRIGDRHSDLARLDWHAAQHGLDGLPESFFVGYQLPGLEPSLSLHRLAIALIRAEDAFDMLAVGVAPAWQDNLARTVAAVERDLKRLPALLDGLERVPGDRSPD